MLMNVDETIELSEKVCSDIEHLGYKIRMEVIQTDETVSCFLEPRPPLGKFIRCLTITNNTEETKNVGFVFQARVDINPSEIVCKYVEGNTDATWAQLTKLKKMYVEHAFDDQFDLVNRVCEAALKQKSISRLGARSLIEAYAATQKVADLS